jgi:hypothetical protein
LQSTHLYLPGLPDTYTFSELLKNMTSDGTKYNVSINSQ